MSALRSSGRSAVKYASFLFSICILGSACQEPAALSPPLCLSGCDGGAHNLVDAIPIGSAVDSGQVNDASDSTERDGDPGPIADSGTGAMPTPACSTIGEINACLTTEACWFAAPGCAEPQTLPPTLPQNLSGCRDADILCIDGQCPNGLECQTFVTDPCIGQPCEACGEFTAMCVSPEDGIPACGAIGPNGVQLQCERGFYCQFPPEAQCGTLEAGRCLTRPENCPEDCPRVCGCDGQTYCNSCEAAVSGTGVLHSGFCPAPQAPPGTCIQRSHPSVRVVAEGDACAAIDFQCEPGQRRYGDPCSCGCIDEDTDAFGCNEDSDCVPEDCCRPTGCVAENAAACLHDEVELCCFCADCRPAIEACACIGGLCHTRFDEGTCQ